MCSFTNVELIAAFVLFKLFLASGKGTLEAWCDGQIDCWYRL